MCPINSAASYILTDELRGRLTVMARQFYGTGQAEEAEDAVQETLMRLWTVRDRIEGGEEGVLKLATRVLKNYCVSQWRHQQQTAVYDDYARNTQPSLTHRTPQTEAESADADRRLEAALNLLPDKERRVFVMKQIDEAETADVATALGIKEHSVQTLLARARRALAEHLGLTVPKPRK